MQSARKSITLMLMKVGIISKLILASIAAVAFLLIPQVAGQAKAAESYLFYYEKGDAAAIKQAVTDGNLNGLRGTSVHATGWEATARTGSKKLDFSLRGVSKASRTVTYEGVVRCGSGDNYDDHTITAHVRIPENFDSQNKLEGRITFNKGLNGLSCLPSGLADESMNVQYLNATKGDNFENFKTAAGVGDNGDPDPSKDNGNKTECTTAGGMGWIVCGAINYFEEFVTFVEEKLIAPMFEVDPLSFNTNADDNPLYATWSVMRTLANVFFVLIFVVVIFANLFSLEPYNVKKILPKLVVAAILIQLSYVFMAAAIDVTNILGKGMRDLLDGIMPDIQYRGGISGDLILFSAGAIVAAALAAKIAAAGILAAALPLAIGFLVIMLTLVFRQTLLVLLIMTAPIAIVAMTLPNTENFFRKWMDLFIRVLLMYPMIVLLFVAGRLAAYSALSINANGTLEAVSPLVAMLCMGLPLIAAPFTFMWAGGLMQKIGSATLKSGSKVQSGIQNSDMMKNRQADRKRKATLGADTSLGRTSFGPRSLRTRWQNKTAGGGFFRNSATARRRIGAEKEKILSDDQKALGRQFETETSGISSMDERKSLLMQIASGKARGYKNDQASKNFAISKLAQYRGFDQIRSLQAAGGTGISTAINSSFSDIDKAAPDITRGDFKAIESMSPATLTDLDPSTIDSYLRDGELKGDLGARQENLGRLLTGVSSSDPLRNNFNGQLLGKLGKLAGENKLGAESSRLASELTMNPDGKSAVFKRREPASPGSPPSPPSSTPRPGSNTGGGSVTFSS